MTAKDADHHLRSEPGDGRQREIGALLAIGRDCSDVVLEPRGPENLPDGQQNHEQDRRDVVAGRDVLREPDPRYGQDQHAGDGDEGADNQHIEDLVDLRDPLEHRDQDQQTDDDQDGVDGQDQTDVHGFGVAVADDTDPILVHDSVHVEEDRANPQQEGNQQEGLPERGGAQHHTNALPRTFPRRDLLIILHGFVRVDEQGDQDAETRGHDTHKHDVNGGEAHLRHQNAHHQPCENSTQVHEQVPEVERWTLRRLAREPLVGGLERGTHHGHGETHRHEHEGHQDDAAGEGLLADVEEVATSPLRVPCHPCDTEGGQATQNQRHMQRLARAEPVGHGAADQHGHADGAADEGVDVAGPFVVEAKLVGHENRQDREQGEVAQRVEDVDALNTPEPLRAIAENREALQVLDDGVAPRRAFFF